MTLFSLAGKNIRGNLGQYFVYFVSLVFSMVIYYTFVSLQYNEKIQENILLSDTMNFMFLASSVMLLLFVAVFILYSNSFFTRKRKKEVGLYSLLGLPKKTIGKMLFYENLLMGLLALVIGILLGTLLSKLFSMVLIKLMGTTVAIDFDLSVKAILQTVIVFLILILFTSVQGYRLIYRFKLIDLFHAEKQGEQLPQASVWSTTVGMILFAVSYWLILRPFPEEITEKYLFVNYGLALVALIIGTHLFFRSVTVYLLKLSQRFKSRYYRGTALIETGQLLHRIRGNARTFTIIALLSAVTISFFGATYSGYYGNEKNAQEMAPFSYTYLSKSKELDTKINHEIEADHDHPIKAKMEIPVIETKGKLSFHLDYDTSVIKVIPASTFNQAVMALDRQADVVKLAGNQAAVIKPRLTENKESVFKGKTLSLSGSQENQSFRLERMIDGSILPFDYPDFFVVISDERFADLAKQVEPLRYQAYEVEQEKTAAGTSKQVNRLVGKDFQVSPSFYTKYKEGKEGNALTLFIFGFLGLVFLAATGSILYFKQLTEAGETKGNYEILQKIGVSKKEIGQSIKKQALFVFGLPLTVGILHSTVILHFTSNFVSDLIGTNMMIPIITAMAAFVIIYVGYYVMTVKTYNKMVNK